MLQLIIEPHSFGSCEWCWMVLLGDTILDAGTEDTRREAEAVGTAAWLEWREAT